MQDHWPLWLNITAFLIATGVIAGVGPRLARLADVLADRTGMGEALMGALLLGAGTSLPGITASVTAAIDGNAELAVSNSFGGIAAQIMFLAIADLTLRKANLEHAAASTENIVFGALLIAIIGLIILAMHGPDYTLLGIHPATPIVLFGYVFGLRVAQQTRKHPMWHPEETDVTTTDKPDQSNMQGTPLSRLVVSFSIACAIVAAAGWVVGEASLGLAEQTGLSGSFVGAAFTAVSTSMPELIVSIAAVRQGALTLAVANIMGGNTFDTLFVAVADIFYRDGSIYHAAGDREVFIGALAIVMTSILTMGLVRRERSGIANIGFESVAVLVLYFAGLATIAFMN